MVIGVDSFGMLGKRTEVMGRGRNENRQVGCKNGDGFSKGIGMWCIYLEKCLKQVMQIGRGWRLQRGGRGNS